MLRVSTAVTIALISAVVSATTPETRAQGVCGEWEVVPTPVPVTGPYGSSQFRDIASIAPDDAWAVGYITMGSPTWETHTLAMHWNGTEWSVVPTPNPSTSINSLDAVEVVSSDDVWAAGVKEVFTPFRTLYPLILHWDGTSWEEVIDSNLEIWGGVLYTIEVAGPDDIWFGGDVGLTIHWDGSNFDVHPVETFDTGSCSGTYGCGHAVEDIAVIAPDDAWAVGGAGDSDYSFVSQIWHWNGQQWTHVPGPSISYFQRLNGVVALASDNVWAVGDLDPADPNDNGMLIIHWDGTQWSRVSTPLYSQPSGDLQDVIALTPDDIWAAGIYTDEPLPAPGLPLTMHYDGVDWRQVMPDPNGPAGAWLRGLTSSGGCDLWSVGSSLGKPHVQRFHPLVPSLRLASIDGDDSCPGGAGHANSVWEPGEQVQIPVTLTAFSGGFTNVVGTLTSSSPGVTILDNTASWPDVTAGGSVTSHAPHFTIAIDPGVDCGTVLSFDLSVAAAEGGPFMATFDREVGEELIVSGPGGVIPNYDPTGMTSELTVTQDFTLTDLDIRVQIDHGYVGDIKIEVESPSGTRITLLDRPGEPGTWFGCEDDDMDVTFDDASSYDLETHCEGTDPWYVGVAAPVQPLSAFLGESTAGTWKLIVSDHLTGNAGSLLGWDFLPTPSLGGTCTVCGGSTTGISAIAAAEAFGLAPARPNPFGASAELAFSHLTVGRHSFSWNGTDSRGKSVAAGTYFVRLTSGGRSELARVVRLR
jgi:subtilisin-like proprotein convertase family protein